MNRQALCAALSIALCTLAPQAAHAFCGFYVGKAGAELYNHASQVVLVRDGPRTVLTMSNDYEGNFKDFALVVPVPVVLEKEQIHIGDRKLVQRLDSYSSPRLVEYFDPNPCERRYYDRAAAGAMAPPKAEKKSEAREERAAALGVKIEAEYTVGEYDIVILSAKQSDGLETFLKQEGYQIPARASAALQPYIKQGMKFFVAKVNLKEQQATGFSYLRPIQMAYESEKFMLPIRLGMANSKGGEQDLLVYTLTKSGRVESTNYKTVKIPSGQDIPLFVKSDFSRFYQALFQQAHKGQDYRAVHTEYVWDTGWCDPCADQPLTNEELRGLGVFWLNQPQPGSGAPSYPGRRYNPGGSGHPVVTRLHVRYDAEHFPEDLMFQETGDRQNFQARYVLRHAAKGDLSCEAGQGYLRQLEQRHAREADTLVQLTGWSRDEVLQKMGEDAPGKGQPQQGGDNWYKNLWNK